MMDRSLLSWSICFWSLCCHAGGPFPGFLLVVGLAGVTLLVIRRAPANCYYTVTAGLITEAIRTTNTISIMVMMMTTSLSNMAHHEHCVVATIIPQNIVLRKYTILMT